MIHQIDYSKDLVLNRPYWRIDGTGVHEICFKELGPALTEKSKKTRRKAVWYENGKLIENTENHFFGCSPSFVYDDRKEAYTRALYVTKKQLSRYMDQEQHLEHEISLMEGVAV